MDPSHQLQRPDQSVPLTRNKAAHTQLRLGGTVLAGRGIDHCTALVVPRVLESNLL